MEPQPILPLNRVIENGLYYFNSDEYYNHVGLDPDIISLWMLAAQRHCGIINHKRFVARCRMYLEPGKLSRKRKLYRSDILDQYIEDATFDEILTWETRECCREKDIPISTVAELWNSALAIGKRNCLTLILEKILLPLLEHYRANDNELVLFLRDTKIEKFKNWPTFKEADERRDIVRDEYYSYLDPMPFYRERFLEPFHKIEAHLETVIKEIK